MSMHISVVSIEGDHLDEIADVLRKCEYVIEDSFTVPTGDQASRELDWNPDCNRVAKVAYVADGWTFIVDPELVLMVNDVWLEFFPEVEYSGCWLGVRRGFGLVRSNRLRFG